jgi:uncharacterized membrane protein
VGYVIVLLLSVAVGYGVYWLTLRTGGEEVAPGPGPEVTEPSEPALERAPAPEAAEEGAPAGTHPQDTAYLPVSTARPSWQNRLQGALGLVIVVVVGAVLLAFALVQGFSLLGRLFSDAAGS